MTEERTPRNSETREEFARPNDSWIPASILPDCSGPMTFVQVHWPRQRSPSGCPRAPELLNELPSAQCNPEDAGCVSLRLVHGVARYVQAMCHSGLLVALPCSRVCCMAAWLLVRVSTNATGPDMCQCDVF